MDKTKEMSHKERILAALSKEEVDYSPCVIYYHSLSKVVRGNRPITYPWGEIISISERTKYNVEKMGVSQIVDFDIPRRRIHEDVKSKIWRENDLLVKEYTTPAGSMRAIVQSDLYWTHGNDIPLSTDWTANFKKAWIENEQDLECAKYLFVPWEPNRDEYLALKDAFRKTKEFADQLGLPIAANAGQG